MLRELRTFIAVAQYGTFSAAAARIGLTQSAVSAQMQRLEGELGLTLFERTGRSASLSQAGRKTLALAQDLIALYGKLGRPDGEPDEHGTLRIGSIASTQMSFAADAIADFRVALPGWRVRVVPGVSLNLLAQVDSEEVDAAVLIRPPFALPNELEWSPLIAEPFVVLVAAGLADRPWRQVLQSEPFIRYDRASFGGRLVDKFLRRTRIPVMDAVELDELPAIARLVAQRVGVALLPLYAGARGWPDGTVALPLGEATFHREIGLVRKRHGMHSATQRFTELLRAAAVRYAAENDSIFPGIQRVTQSIP